MHTEQRRRLLQGLAIATPLTWTRPVVESAVLPAHAQTTSPSFSITGRCAEVGDDQYYLVTFSPSPATLDSSVIVTPLNSVPALSGDQAVFYGAHSPTQLTIRFATSNTTGSYSNSCSSPEPEVFTTGLNALPGSGLGLNWLVTWSGSSGSPSAEMSGFFLSD